MPTVQNSKNHSKPPTYLNCPNCPDLPTLPILYYICTFLIPPFLRRQQTFHPTSTMAKLSVTVTFLFFLLTVIQARDPSNVPEDDDVIDRELPPRSHAGPDDVSSVLRLPSDKVNDESQSTHESTKDIPESYSIPVRAIPLRVVRFRPIINRHFPIRSRLPFQFHNCRHHYDRPFFKPIRQQEEQQKHVEIPYGNDMILSNDENNEFDPFMFHHGRMRRIPARWAKLHDDHHHDDNDRDEDVDDGFSKYVLKHSHDRFGKEKFQKHLHHRHDDDHHEENGEMMKKRDQAKRGEEEGGFMNRIRKFLDHF